MLKSVNDIVEALGGTTAVAGMMGVTRPAVSNWKFRGKIPAALFDVLSEELNKKRLKVSPAAFGMRSRAGTATAD